MSLTQVIKTELYKDSRRKSSLILLRIGKRSTVMIGKYLAVVFVSFFSIAATVAVSALSYYLLIADSGMGTGTFFSTIEGIVTWEIWGTIGLQMAMYLIWIGMAFLLGLFANPFVTFLLTLVVVYAGNYLAGADWSVSRFFPSHWSNELMVNGGAPAGWMEISLSTTVLLAALFLTMAVMVFRNQDVKRGRLRMSREGRGNFFFLGPYLVYTFPGGNGRISSSGWNLS